MTEIITTTEMLDKMDDFIPDLLKHRDRIDSMILDIKTFRVSNSAGSDRSKINVIFKVVMTYFDITKEDLKGPRGRDEIPKGRQIFCALAREITELSYQAIGDYVNRDHTTVIHSKRVISDARDTSHVLYDHYEVVKKNVLVALDSI